MQRNSKGRTVHQQARFLLGRMNLAAAEASARRYAEAAGLSPGSGPGGAATPLEQYWLDVADLIEQRRRGAVTLAQIHEKANADDAYWAGPRRGRSARIRLLPQEDTTLRRTHSHQTPAPTSTPGPEPAAEANLGTPEYKLALIVRALLFGMNQASTAVTKFKADLETGLVSALAWSQPVFTAVAKLEVFTTVWRALTSEAGEAQLWRETTNPPGNRYNTLERASEQARKEVIRRAQIPTRSTNQTSNLMEQEFLSAWAEVVEIIEWRH
jgi:hypothetical protein